MVSWMVRACVRQLRCSERKRSTMSEASSYVSAKPEHSGGL